MKVLVAVGSVFWCWEALQRLPVGGELPWGGQGSSEPADPADPGAAALESGARPELSRVLNQGPGDAHCALWIGARGRQKC